MPCEIEADGPARSSTVATTPLAACRGWRYKNLEKRGIVPAHAGCISVPASFRGCAPFQGRGGTRSLETGHHDWSQHGDDGPCIRSGNPAAVDLSRPSSITRALHKDP